MVYYTCEGWLSTDARGVWLTVNLLVKELVHWLLFVEKLTLFCCCNIYPWQNSWQVRACFNAYCPRFYPDPFWRICRGALGWQLPNELGEYPSQLGAGLMNSCQDAFNIFQLPLSIQEHGQIRAKIRIIASMFIHLYHESCLCFSVEEILLFRFLSSSSAEALKTLILSTTESLLNMWYAALFEFLLGHPVTSEIAGIFS